MALIVYVHLKVHFEGSSTPTPNKSNNDHHRGEARRLLKEMKRDAIYDFAVVVAKRLPLSLLSKTSIFKIRSFRPEKYRSSRYVIRKAVIINWLLGTSVFAYWSIDEIQKTKR